MTKPKLYGVLAAASERWSPSAQRAHERRGEERDHMMTKIPPPPDGYWRRCSWA